ncbi:LuxR C-terminal-related transcriptional regulator [Peribacillus butanolivorans]|uniref:helix-turn-helix transcriptional regulator n=1 Tax=Peribacillus butanolivorans TaxID=421767 RepID=UPI00207D3832|nr:LuxR C-terminal-related transcriptional regulator [Peribacillus butanolivorans]MCO0600577.1 LuxR C-terminal-related transcriptional regulator [Peribacillus butanolivorans]
MLEETLLNHVKNISIQKDMRNKSKMIVKGCVDFFSFQRASLFSYSCLSGMGEGIYSCTSKETISLHHVKENIHDIYPIHQALINNKPVYLTIKHTKSSIPAKYVKRFAISSLAVIPVILNEMVIGFVLVDPIQTNEPVTKHDLMKLSHYLELAVSTTLESSPPSYLLSNREVEVLQYLANGLGLKQMAPKMRVSEYTVRDYISSAIRKLGVNHRTEAVAVAIRHKIII